MISLIRSSIELEDDDSISVLTSTSNESSSNDGGISKKRKRRRPKSSWIMYQDRDNLALLPRLVIPRVIRNDIRRFYPHMLANVYNTQQYDYMWNFMERYFRQDYRLCEQTLVAKAGKIRGRYEIAGLEKCGHYWYERMRSLPDGVFTVHESQVQVLSDEIGVVIMKFSLAGSHLLPVQHIRIHASKVVVDDNPRKTTTIPFSTSSSSRRSSSDPTEDGRLASTDNITYTNIADESTEFGNFTSASIDMDSASSINSTREDENYISPKVFADEEESSLANLVSEDENNCEEEDEETNGTGTSSQSSQSGFHNSSITSPGSTSPGTSTPSSTATSNYRIDSSGSSGSNSRLQRDWSKRPRPVHLEDHQDVNVTTRAVPIRLNGYIKVYFDVDTRVFLTDFYIIY